MKRNNFNYSRRSIINNNTMDLQSSPVTTSEEEQQVPSLVIPAKTLSNHANKISSETLCNRSQFWGAMSIFIEKPHLLNKRLCGVVDLWWGVLDSAVSLDQISTDKLKLDGCIDRTWQILQEHGTPNIPSSEDTESSVSMEAVNSQESSYVKDILTELKTFLTKDGFLGITPENDSRFQPWEQLSDDAVYVVVRRSLPKSVTRYHTTLETIFLDSSRNVCTFLSNCKDISSQPQHFQHKNATDTLEPKEFYESATDEPPNEKSEGATDVEIVIHRAALVPCLPFSLHFMDELITLSLGMHHISSKNSGSSGVSWLKEQVLPKIAKWAQQVSLSGETDSNGSLTLVDLQAYSLLYSSLKNKYANKLIQSWQERTDPHKFVHEDIGIAAYILLLWRARGKPQRFVDLGCGNGLLVYLLTSEGHVGTGFDLKRRNIWGTFPDNIDLQEREVRPCDSCLDPNVDWLLGNHSDELTPWIPVMAARTSFTCSFFVLPCCPHDFTAKFLRRNSGISQNTDYLNYIEEVGQVCGFEMNRDRLKIPSTKRVCFVGQSRTHSVENWPSILEKMQTFINDRVSLYSVNNLPNRITNAEESLLTLKNNENLNFNNLGHTEGTNKDKLWGAGFVARPKTQRTRNCTQLKQGVREDIVKAVLDLVLQADQPKEADASWRGVVPCELRDVAAALGQRRLVQIKQESGGLQTLLKNHRHIFRVERGTVSLRSPARVDSEDQKRHRQCWFEVHHPQGCPNHSKSCLYTHTQTNADTECLIQTA